MKQNINLNVNEYFVKMQKRNTIISGLMMVEVEIYVSKQYHDKYLPYFGSKLY